jgi:beta-phosphoglucomutase-like phosphatase (HAD superfamily)
VDYENSRKREHAHSMTAWPAPVEAVILDMDGLLLDTERVYRNAFIAAATRLGFEMREEFYQGLVGLADNECYALIQDHLGPRLRMAQYRREFADCMEQFLTADIPLKSGATELMDELARRGLPRAVATSTNRTTAEIHLRRAGLFHRFDAVVTWEDVERGKPHPDLFLKVGAIDAFNAVRAMQPDARDRRRGLPISHRLEGRIQRRGYLLEFFNATMELMHSGGPEYLASQSARLAIRKRESRRDAFLLSRRRAVVKSGGHELAGYDAALGLFFQAADDELRTIARQDFLLGGLLLAIVDSFFFLRPLCRQLLVLGRHHRWLTCSGSAIQAIKNELRTIPGENFFLGGLFLTAVYLFSFFCPLRNHLLMLGRDGNAALSLAETRRR